MLSSVLHAVFIYSPNDFSVYQHYLGEGSFQKFAMTSPPRKGCKGWVSVDLELYVFVPSAHSLFFFSSSLQAHAHRKKFFL